MSWLIAIGLALAAFVIAAFLFRLPRATWTTLLAALALGLAGYGMQAHPDMRGAPKAARADAGQSEWALIDARKELVADEDRSRSPKLLVADALARRGQYANAAAMLRGAVHDNPADAEAWLALGNALVEHADGAMTEPALVAYRRSAAANPRSLAPGYFLGLAMLRQGRLGEGYEVWRATLAGTPQDAFGRETVALRFGRLGQLLKQAGMLDGKPAQPAK